jgi:molybdopterin-guanine dinucleotide biosynthesis protein A
LSQQDPSKTATAFISTHDDLPEPLCAIWQGNAFETILKLFNAGIYCPRKILIKSDTCLIKQQEAHWLDNVNTLEEYVQVKSQNNA